MLFFTRAESEIGVREELSATSQTQVLCEGPAATPALLE